MSFEPGQRIGDYEVLDVLGAGGMGRVYKVRNVISDRLEAIKVLLPDLVSEPELAERFLREIKVQASLDHPHIAKLYTAQRIDNQLIMVMEYVEGQTLSQIAKQGRVPLADTLRYMDEVLSALAYAHARGIVHRDIKPANMMRTPSGALKLMDFGIARLASDSQLTRTGLTVGSLAYMSPEQISGVTLDGRADLYSMGITLYQLATGHMPFDAQSEYSLMAAHLHQPPRPPREVEPSLPPMLNDIILMALAKDPAQRFQTAEAFRGALRNVVAAPMAATATLAAKAAPLSAAPPAAPSAQGSRALYILAGSLATLAVLILAAMQLPVWNKTKAVNQAPAATAVEQPQQLPESQTPPPQTSAQPTPDAPPNKPAQEGRTVAKPAPQRPSRPAVEQPRAEPQSTPAPAVVQQPPQLPPSAQAPAQPAADRAELKELRERIMMMGVRVSSARGTLDRLRREQAAMGLGLRGDITSADQRLGYFLDEAEAALKNGDAAQARQRIDAAERELGRLESFLGK